MLYVVFFVVVYISVLFACLFIYVFQQSGFTVVAEKLNFYRYLSHFRAVHRGAFFSEMRTTSVRKLLPESWGKVEIDWCFFVT